MAVRAHIDLPVPLDAGQVAPALGSPPTKPLHPHRAASAYLRHGEVMRFLLIASFPDSILQFRGALLDALQAQGLDVHVAAPGLDAHSPMGRALQARGTGRAAGRESGGHDV